MKFLDKIGAKLGLSKSSVLMIVGLLVILGAFLIAKNAKNHVASNAPVTAADNTTANDTTLNGAKDSNSLTKPPQMGIFSENIGVGNTGIPGDYNTAPYPLFPPQPPSRVNPGAMSQLSVLPHN